MTDTFRFSDAAIDAYDAERELLTEKVPGDVDRLSAKADFVRFPINEHSTRLVERLKALAPAILREIAGGVVLDNACCSASAIEQLAEDYGAYAYVGSDILHVRDRFTRRQTGKPHLLTVRGDALKTIARCRERACSLVTLSGLDSEMDGPRMKPHIHADYLRQLTFHARRVLRPLGSFVFGLNAQRDMEVLNEAARDTGLQVTRLTGKGADDDVVLCRRKENDNRVIPMPALSEETLAELTDHTRTASPIEHHSARDRHRGNPAGEPTRSAIRALFPGLLDE